MSFASVEPSRLSRRSQQERRDGTQRKLLEATLACLIELGHARTTTTEVVRRAGVSQGALFKHYPSKAELLAAAVALLFEQLVAGYELAFRALPQHQASAEAAFELLWAHFRGPRLAVAFELYIVARTEPTLAACLAPVVQHHRAVLVEHARVLFPEAAQREPEFGAWVDLLMCSMEGIVIEGYGAGTVAPGALSVLKRLMLETLRADRTRHATIPVP